MRVFVTGGSGFLGRNLLTMLKARGDEVRALARSASAAEIVRERGAVPVAGDLDDEDALARGMTGCDVVYHSGALVADWGRPRDFYRVNVAGTERALAAAHRAFVSRFVHVSTEAVLLGGRPIIRADETWPRPKHAIGDYARTKALAEERVLAASPQLAAMIVRPRLIWGKGDTTILPELVRAVEKKRFAWIGGGRHLTSTCHVANACEALVLAAEKGKAGGIYFATDGEPLELRVFFSELLASQGVTPGSRSLPFSVAYAAAYASEALWRVSRRRTGPPITRSTVKLFGEEVTVLDAKARRELGYTAHVSRDQGLRAMRA